MNNKKVGQYCAKFREERLGVSTYQLAKSQGIPYRVLLQFEYGNSSNVSHLLPYWRACNTLPLQREFEHGLFEQL